MKAEPKSEEKDSLGSQSIKVHGHVLETPRFGPFRIASQKMQQCFLDYPSVYAMCMIVISCLKYFVQIFDMLTDATIGKQNNF